MYDDHYGLTGRPFQLTPDPRFWFETATHRKAMAYLGFGLAQGEGFIVITGDVGAGKTTLVGHLIATTDPTRLHVVKIVSTQIEAEDLLRMVAAGLDIEGKGLTKAQLLAAIEQGLHGIARSGRRTLLIVDEAQALPVASLEELRMLSNFQAGAQALLQIVLLGQPEFRDRLYGSDRLEQLRQRVIAVHHLEPMGRDEVAPYIQHRLSVVGGVDRPRFTRDAFDTLYDVSEGVPRRLNQLAGRVLLFGALEQLTTIDADAVRVVVADIAGDLPGTKLVAPLAKASNGGTEPTPLFRVTPPSNDHDPIRMVGTSDKTLDPRQDPDQTREASSRALEGRIVRLEARIEEQDVALRRVLTLLVDWAEAPPGPGGFVYGSGN
ncbi:ExeA family protein [Sphingomonas echinoides]|uniref:ExeA family protein n=1 Tax=Sphingomonas echinoides TaxID=59803 RepID=UPI00241307BC|nr:AAA family ATPase [Sphingomonas echinoides]